MKILTVIISMAIVSTLFSQVTEKNHENTDQIEAKILQVVNDLFNGMRDSDSALVRSLFHEDAKLKSTYFYEKMDKSRIIDDNLEDFIKAVGTPKKEKWNEKIANVIVLQDDFFAQVWMDYAFYIDDIFSHCGINSIQMLLTDSGWKIIDITDTRRKKDCKVDSND